MRAPPGRSTMNGVTALAGSASLHVAYRQSDVGDATTRPALLGSLDAHRVSPVFAPRVVRRTTGNPILELRRCPPERRYVLTCSLPMSLNSAASGPRFGTRAPRVPAGLTRIVTLVASRSPPEPARSWRADRAGAASSRRREPRPLDPPAGDPLRQDADPGGVQPAPKLSPPPSRSSARPRTSSPRIVQGFTLTRSSTTKATPGLACRSRHFFDRLNA